MAKQRRRKPAVEESLKVPEVSQETFDDVPDLPSEPPIEELSGLGGEYVVLVHKRRGVRFVATDEVYQRNKDSWFQDGYTIETDKEKARAELEKRVNAEQNNLARV